MKSLHVVLVESIIVGILLVLFTYITSYITCSIDYSSIFLAGILFHLVFEYTGLNERYARHYLSS